MSDDQAFNRRRHDRQLTAGSYLVVCVVLPIIAIALLLGGR